MESMEVRHVTHEARADLYVTRDGTFYRHYRDTDAWEGPLPPSYDDYGNQRYGTRLVAPLVTTLYATQDTYRGGGTTTTADGATPHRPPAPRIHATMRRLVEGVRDVNVLAKVCGNVQPTTAWCYATQAVQHWPKSAMFATALLYHPLWEECQRMDDVELAGSLKAVMERVDARLETDGNWKEVEDPYAQLRLARLCVQALRGN